MDGVDDRRASRSGAILVLNISIEGLEGEPLSQSEYHADNRIVDGGVGARGQRIFFLIS